WSRGPAPQRSPSTPGAHHPDDPSRKESGMTNTEDTRFERGWRRLLEVDAASGERLIESLQDVAPDLGRYVVEFAYGEIFERPILDLRQRELVTLAALTTLGGAERELEVHVNAGLNVGLSAREILKAITPSTP